MSSQGEVAMTWKWQLDEECMKVGLNKEDMLYSSKLIVGANQLTTRLR